MKEESKPNELTLITPSMIRVLEKRRYNSSMAKCQHQTDWLAKFAYEVKTSSAYKEVVNAILVNTDQIVTAMVKEENESLVKSILSGGSVMFVDFVHNRTNIAHTIEEYIDFKCRMSIPYTRRFFIDKDGILIKTIEPMGYGQQSPTK